MTKRAKKRLIFISILIGIMAIALVDALDLTVDKPYNMIPHGSHNHYVPHDKDPDVSVHNFPMEAPKADERIMPDGKIVKIK